VYEFDVDQQIGNTCAARALINSLESLYSPGELQGTGFKDIDKNAVEEDSKWIESHLDVCDLEMRIFVVELLPMISDSQNHHLLLYNLLDTFVPNRTTIGLIVGTATAAQLDSCCGGEGSNDAAEHARKKLQHWIYMEVNFDEEPVVYYADSQAGMEQGLKRHGTIEAAAQVLAAAVVIHL
jgi:hypothetical protein